VRQTSGSLLSAKSLEEARCQSAHIRRKSADGGTSLTCRNLLTNRVKSVKVLYNVHRLPEEVMVCERCGKVSFSSRALAEGGIREIWTEWNTSGPVPTHSYFDRACGVWHLDSEPASQMVVLRDYQEYAVQAIFNYFASNSGNPIISCPTGTGKSVIIGEFVRRAMNLYPKTRILMLTHRKELIQQNLQNLLKMWPTAPAGVYSAGLKRKEHQHPITFAGIQTIYRKAVLFGHIDIVLIDECHLVSPKEDTTYKSFINDLKLCNPKLKLVGFSATPYRLKMGMLTDEGGLFSDVPFDLSSRDSFNWLIQQGWLVPLVPKKMQNMLDVSNVRIQGGEFNQTELQEAVDRESVTYAALKEAVAVAHDRKHWLVFASGIEHAEHVATQLDSLGVDAVVVHSKLEESVRDRRIEDFSKGRHRAIVNNNILTTGYDYPDIDCIVMLRPTASPGLWVQMCGRGTRPLSYISQIESVEGRLAAIQESAKPNCLVLDFAGNTARLGPINDPVLPRRPGRGAPAPPPVRLCEHCDCYSHAASRFCEHCGAEFPRMVKISTTASIAELIAGPVPGALPIVPVPEEVFDVQHVTYKLHSKIGKPDSMRVDYYCGLQRFSEFVCLDHGGRATHNAKRWWQARCPWGVPPSVAEGMLAIDSLKRPVKIKVRMEKKYGKVVDYEFAE
jgi:DNA repair protein RadD